MDQESGAGDAESLFKANYCPDGVMLDYPAPPPRDPCAKPGIQCTRVDEQPRAVVDVYGEPQMVLGPKQPIEFNWPPKPDPAPAVKTGPREDPLSQIPDYVVPQIVTMVQPGKSTAMQRSLMNHPLCPDGQMHIVIDPPQKKEIEIRIPELTRQLRLPTRPWNQCVENSLINDQVRRPLARWCHKRQLPPLVLPLNEIQSLKLLATETERLKAECEQRKAKREYEKCRSHCRHSTWNYTTESLLQRKKQREAEKERMEVEGTQELMKEVASQKERQSKEENVRAQKLMLYRKGLIRDFHASMAYSKMMQDIDKTKKGSSQAREDGKGDAPFLNKRCMKKMLYENNRPEYTKQEAQKRPVAQKRLLEALKKVEARQKEQEAEIDEQRNCIKYLSTQYLPEQPPSYIKAIAEPKCDDDAKCKRQCELKRQLVEEIHNKLAVDAFIEAHEDEIDRQACEFNNYKRTVDNIRKAKEKQLIDEKVAYNIKMSEKAAAVLVEMQKKKKAAANDYDALKEKWEAEWEEKAASKGKGKERIMELAYADFEKRKCAEEWKWNRRDDASRQWARQRLVEVEDYFQDCEQKNDRRKVAEDIMHFNKALASEKRCREARGRYMDHVWYTKMKQEYEQEMCEMKAYASDCIKDWSAKGRNSFPMEHAMKKWDYDAGMYPFPPVATSASIDPKETPQTEASEGISGRETNHPGYNTTAMRLGFSCGGT